MTAPYYQDGLVTLFHGDCLEITEWLSADVLVTDPPYGIAYESKRNRDRRNVKVGRPVVADKNTGIRDAALNLWGDRAGLVFGRWDAPRPAATRNRLIWDKGDTPGMGNLRLPWGSSDEEVYVIGKWPPRLSGVGRTGSLVRIPPYNSMSSDRPDHPTPKPVGLMEGLIVKCPPGVIADPFAGSGAALVAAKIQGRRAIGVEIEERYCSIIAERLAQDALPFEDVS